MKPTPSTSLCCAYCSSQMQTQGTTSCYSGSQQEGEEPPFCPGHRDAEIIDDSFQRYLADDEDARLAKVAAQVEGLCYQQLPDSDLVQARWTRVEDTIALAKLMNYRKIGIATCIGLLEESRRLTEILKAQGFEPLSVCCKAGSIDKRTLGLEEQEKVRPGAFEAACNPIAQARLLNQAGSDMNLIVGLCVGHDMLFAKHSAAPVSTLVVKDRVTGHNPAAVLYGQNFYYKRLKKQPVIED